jgi:hypothetical protein
MVTPTSQSIDWTDPHLRIAYLVEGIHRDQYGNEYVVRWCGPKSRTGSGFVARPTMLGMGVFDPDAVVAAAVGETYGDLLTSGRVPFEGRLSGCTFDSSLGSLSQNILVLSEVSFTVDVGDDDVGEEGGTQPDKLLDAAIGNRWRGQPARLIVVDMDNIDRFELIADGTWDRDPTGITSHKMSLTIDVGQVFPPTLKWPSAQVPTNVDQYQNVSFTYLTAAGDLSPPGLGAQFLLNPEQKGQWLGHIFGGVAGLTPGADLWREIVPYGTDSPNFCFAWISPRFDQFCYEIACETSSGTIERVIADAGFAIYVFNNNDAMRGPVGTCVKFGKISGFGWTEGGRCYAQVAGGRRIISRPSDYKDIGFGTTADWGPVIGLGMGVTPDPATVGGSYGPVLMQNVQDLVDDIFTYLVDEAIPVHPGAINDLLSWGVQTYGTGITSAFERTCAVPADLTDEPLPFREGIAGFLKSVPADLILKRDQTSPMFNRKVYIIGRPNGLEEAKYTFTEAALYNTTPKRGVRQLSDPDRNYSNSTTISAGEQWGTPDLVADNMRVPRNLRINLSDGYEQSASATAQVIEGEYAFDHWSFGEETSGSVTSSPGFRQVAAVAEGAKSRPQWVTEAEHGYSSCRVELGDIVRYAIPGVTTDKGQVRGLRMDLDKQTVSVRVYHYPAKRRVTDAAGSADIKYSGNIETKKRPDELD